MKVTKTYVNNQLPISEVANVYITCIRFIESSSEESDSEEDSDG